MCQWLCSSSSGQREPTTCRVKRRCQLRCQCRCDQHDTQPNESPHCTFVATMVSAAATLGAIDEHVLLSGAARQGRACVRMAAVLVFVGLCIAHLTLATLPDRRLAAAPCHLALPAVRGPARRVGTRVSSIVGTRNFHKATLLSFKVCVSKHGSRVRVILGMLFRAVWHVPALATAHAAARARRKRKKTIKC